MRQPVKTIPLVLIVTLCVILFFQNCADPLKSTEDMSSLSDQLPFAYDTTVDTLAYMSCAGGSSAANPKAIWSLAVGAFGLGSGIRLSDSFLTATSLYSSEQRAFALSESSRNQNAVLQLSIRQTLAYQNILTSGGGSGEFGKDFNSLLGPLDDGSMAQKLADVDLAQPERLNYFMGLPGLGNRSLNGAIRFLASESEAASVRGQLSSNGILALTYTDTSESEFGARAPDPEKKNKAVYGRGYRLSFTAPFPTEPEPRVLASVEELNLETGRTTGLEVRPWTCPTNLRFRLARSCAECGCSNDANNDPSLAILRRLLKVEYWYVNMVGRCVVQKEAAAQCYPSSATSSYNFVSVCIRQ